MSTIIPVDKFPPFFVHDGPFGLAVWQWFAFPCFIFLSLATGFFIGRFIRIVLEKFFTQPDSLIVRHLVGRRILGPLIFAMTLMSAYLYAPLIGLGEVGIGTIHRGIRVGLFVVVFWVVLRIIDIVASVLETNTAKLHPRARTLIPLAGRVLKAFIVVIAVIAVLSELDYPVTSLVAGLGIGGLALALAGQKTVENLFGAFSIALDQPIREGDIVCVENFIGTVETVGLRSTRFRTPERTTISIPNGRLAEMRLETFSTRDRIRLVCSFGLAIGTSSATMRQILNEIQCYLLAHPFISQEVEVEVRFAGITETALSVEVVCAFKTSEWSQFTAMRQEVFLNIMEIVERAGTTLAHPIWVHKDLKWPPLFEK